VAQANSSGARRRCGQKDFGRRRMAVFVEKVMLDLPGVVEAEPVGENHLVQRFVEQPLLIARLPRTGKLKLVKYAESHGRGSPFAALIVPTPDSRFGQVD